MLVTAPRKDPIYFRNTRGGEALALTADAPVAKGADTSTQSVREQPGVFIATVGFISVLGRRKQTTCLNVLSVTVMAARPHCLSATRKDLDA